MSASPRAAALAREAARAAAGKLADHVTVLDVSERLVITDCFVVASAPNERQVHAIVDEVELRLREHGARPARREGVGDGRWVLLDFVDVVVHVQHSEEHTFYALDRLWKDCPALHWEEPGQRAGTAGLAAGGSRPASAP